MRCRSSGCPSSERNCAPRFSAVTVFTAPSCSKMLTISRKLKVCGPTRIAAPYCAGSRILWPPVGTRLPPTKAMSRQFVNCGEFPNAIQQKDAAANQLRRLTMDCGVEATNPRRNQSRYFFKPLRMPRRQDHHGRGNVCWTVLNAASSGPSSPSAVLPHTITGESLSMAARRPFTRAGCALGRISNFKLPLTRTRSVCAPISRSRLRVCCCLRQEKIDF